MLLCPANQERNTSSPALGAFTLEKEIKDPSTSAGTAALGGLGLEAGGGEDPERPPTRTQNGAFGGSSVKEWAVVRVRQDTGPREGSTIPTGPGKVGPPAQGHEGPRSLGLARHLRFQGEPTLAGADQGETAAGRGLTTPSWGSNPSWQTAQEPAPDISLRSEVLLRGWRGLVHTC